MRATENNAVPVDGVDFAIGFEWAKNVARDGVRIIEPDQSYTVVAFEY